MAQQTFVVKNHAAADVTFTLQSQDKKTTRYMAPTSRLAAPKVCEVVMDVKPIGSTGSDRVTVAFAYSKLNSVTAKPMTGRASFQLVLPRDSEWADTDTLDVADQLLDYLQKDGFLMTLIDACVP